MKCLKIFIIVFISILIFKSDILSKEMSKSLKNTFTKKETKLLNLSNENMLANKNENSLFIKEDLKGNFLETDALNEIRLTGTGSSDFFGVSVSSAGDVNGDGFDDVIVGAYLNDAGGIDAGRAYIYFGGSSVNNVADVILTGAAASDHFGFSVSSAGDVNGDGFTDVIVGAYGNDAGGSETGRAYIYFGGSNMDNIVDVTLTGEGAGNLFGNSVSTAGDVNGDNFADVIVGAYFNSAGGNQAGRAYIYFGGSSMNNITDVTLTGAAQGDLFGCSVSTAGDVNDDNFADVIVGACNNNAGGALAGRAYIYFGGSSMNNIADVTFTGAAAGDNFGWSVSSAGDFNGDNFTDVIVGAQLNDAGGNNAGRAYIYFGGSSMNNTADAVLTGAAADDLFGYSVSSAGDINGDSFDDVIIGARQNDVAGNNAGRAYIYFGGSFLNQGVDAILTGEAAEDFFGSSVSTAGDINGDGFADVIVGAFVNDAGGFNAGSAYLYSFGIPPEALADLTFTGNIVDNLGNSVSDAGDVNGDGYDDLIIGLPLNSGGGAQAGRAHIYFGGSPMNNIADVILTGATAGDFFGYSVSSAGDVNDDGFADVIIGAPYNDAGGNDAGRAYVYFGGSSMNNTADVTFTGEAAGDNFGWSVSTAGEVSGDVFADVIVGAWLNDAGGSNAGRAYVYFGGSSMNNITDVTLTGEAADNFFGYSVSEAGNVNNDNFSDVIVGAFNNNTSGFQAGKAYIYYGGSPMNNVADVTMTGEAAGDWFGRSVSSAGDVNNDNFADVIVGAYLNDAGGDGAGRAYIYFGGNPMNNVADVMLTGEAAGDRFSSSLSSAGDVNDDGFDDVIVGAELSDAGGLDAGAAYIYYGGNPMNNIVDILLTGAAINDLFGKSVSSFGGVNGDMLPGSGMVVGAPSNDAGGVDAGRAYLYLDFNQGPGSCGGTLNCPLVNLPFPPGSAQTEINPNKLWVSGVCYNPSGKVIGAVQLEEPKLLIFTNNNAAIDVLEGETYTPHPILGNTIRCAGAICKGQMQVHEDAAIAITESHINSLKGVTMTSWPLPAGFTPRAVVVSSNCQTNNLNTTIYVETTRPSIEMISPSGTQTSFVIPAPFITTSESWNTGTSDGVIAFTLNTIYKIAGGVMTPQALPGNFTGYVVTQGTGITVNTTGGPINIPLPGSNIVNFGICTSPMDACNNMPSTIAFNIQPCAPNVNAINAGWVAPLACANEMAFDFNESGPHFKKEHKDTKMLCLTDASDNFLLIRRGCQEFGENPGPWDLPHPEYHASFGFGCSHCSNYSGQACIAMVNHFLGAP